MEIARWTRRDVLKTVSGAAALGVLASYTRAEAQSVKYSAGTEPPKLKAPGNATDCHHHIYDARYPVDPKATLPTISSRHCLNLLSAEDQRSLVRQASRCLP